MAKPTTYRIPEHDIAAAFTAIAKFKDELLSGTASPVLKINDPVVVFTADEIVAGPRAKLAKYFAKNPHTYMEIDPDDGLDYHDLLDIFFCDPFAEEMQKSMGLTMVVLREAQAALANSELAAFKLVQEAERKFVLPMLLKAMAYTANR
ncbi:hypothetical protein MUO32_25960 [Shinella sp. CPCC 101442]|uniref:hypothetical protein n=1 Tax=Shinella sp. CPCC 101442 TaxID=2932265 RepID=UPI002152FF93|nr:hypothetical protein [Shinella sp. CPCC 101442]MCR6502477.1 hypothetical protein [Shinella sp. CPCC 101442]